MKLKNLAKLRQKRGLTQTDVAMLMGLSPGSVAQWESGRAMPTAAHLRMLCDTFRVSPEYLLGMQGARATDGNVIALRKVA